MIRKTKIVCTLGPSTDNEETLRKLIQNGMNVARINFSHQTHEQQQVRIDMFKKVRAELGVPVALLADTKGPEIRLGTFEKPVVLEKGAQFTLSIAEREGNSSGCKVSFAGLPNDVRRDTRILIADGLIELCVDSVTDTEIVCTVINGGMISSNKGVNVPGIRLNMPYISSADRADLRFAMQNDFDFVAMSFTRSADDVLAIREELERLRCHDMKLIAKIENAEGVTNIEEILKVSDGIMVARGDLGVEVALEEIPIIQKKLIRKAYYSGKPVITATQMLESMMHNPRPTRAEATDVATAIFDGTSATMLSGETAAGDFPIEALGTMSRIIMRTERDIDYKTQFNRYDSDESLNVTDAISHATCAAAHDLNAACIITVTTSGDTAKMISKFRPAVPIVGCSPSEKSVNQLALSWGVAPLLIDIKDNTDELFDHAIETAVQNKFALDGDLLVITAGVPLGVSGTTNMLRVHVVGDPTL